MVEKTQQCVSLLRTHRITYTRIYMVTTSDMCTSTPPDSKTRLQAHPQKNDTSGRRRRKKCASQDPPNHTVPAPYVPPRFLSSFPKKQQRHYFAKQTSAKRTVFLFLKNRASQDSPSRSALGRVLREITYQVPGCTRMVVQPKKKLAESG